MMQRTLIWDLPTRVFHWSLATSFALAWLTAESDAWLTLHVFCGYLMFALVVFRLLWGMVGSHFSRFANFWFAPSQVLAYLNQLRRGQAPRHIGHNPAGSLAIYLLLLLAFGVTVSGVLTLGAEEQHGLAAGWFGMAQAKLLKNLHEAAATAMLLLVGLHVSGVIFESVMHGENLARAMLDGHKMAQTPTPKTRRHGALAFTMLLLMLIFALWWFGTKPSVGGPAESAESLPDNATWREECGSCHTAFYPSLLPERSWQKLMASQDQHFGSDLGLAPETSQVVLDFLRTHAADRHLTEAGFKTDQSLPPEAVPLRITDTPYWHKKHRKINSADWQKPQVKSQNNCSACHSDADAGTYDDGAMRIP